MVQDEDIFIANDDSSSISGFVGTSFKPQIQPTVLRKTFSETWIWNNIIEEG